MSSRQLSYEGNYQLGEWSLKGSSASPDCRADGHGLRLTMLIVSLWLFMGVIFFGVATYLAYRLYKNRNNEHVLLQNNRMEKKEKVIESRPFLKSKRASHRHHLQEPLLNLDDENTITL
jgi:hypothetical protein